MGKRRKKVNKYTVYKTICIVVCWKYWRIDMKYDYYPCDNEVNDVDVMVLVYNHEKYIVQAIESILQQETKHTFRILIGEDCSTDNTRSIIMDYYKKYPNKISLLLWKENVGGNHNANALQRMCKAKYVAHCEGDDYWTDMSKIEKQISFLEENKDYIGTAHNVRCVDEEGRILHRGFSGYWIRESYTYDSRNAFNRELAGQTASLLYRNIWLDMPDKKRKIFEECPSNGDIKINIMLGLSGKIYFFRDIMADHRRVFYGDSWTAKCVGRNMIKYSYKNSMVLRRYIFDLTGEMVDADNMQRSLVKDLKLSLVEKFKIEGLGTLIYLLGVHKYNKVKAAIIHKI